MKEFIKSFLQYFLLPSIGIYSAIIYSMLLIKSVHFIYQFLFE